MGDHRMLRGSLQIAPGGSEWGGGGGGGPAWGGVATGCRGAPDKFAREGGGGGGGGGVPSLDAVEWRVPTIPLVTHRG